MTNLYVLHTNNNVYEYPTILLFQFFEYIFDCKLKIYLQNI
ncbi:hypothetical protein BMW23_0389 [Bodo saltans virus]|uniref:Uncharacterized protein n=1 Tax=Bodo saltans virus TaxID=2024608 RepID=A0A2H4UU24_9VIRU|nr:hypothetical protein QJ851_gp0380 [Bodo saltans virus]ATZ80443.1 hypothetical protein BMW23_0389 [Bodo saltans virus]